LFCFFSCQYSNHVNIFYQFFWASLLDMLFLPERIVEIVFLGYSSTPIFKCPKCTQNFKKSLHDCGFVDRLWILLMHTRAPSLRPLEQSIFGRLLWWVANNTSISCSLSDKWTLSLGVD
jgi:hypothetical protein